MAIFKVLFALDFLRDLNIDPFFMQQIDAYEKH